MYNNNNNNKFRFTAALILLNESHVSNSMPVKFNCVS